MLKPPIVTVALQGLAEQSMTPPPLPDSHVVLTGEN